MLRSVLIIYDNFCLVFAFNFFKPFYTVCSPPHSILMSPQKRLEEIIETYAVWLCTHQIYFNSWWWWYIKCVDGHGMVLRGVVTLVFVSSPPPWTYLMCCALHNCAVFFSVLCSCYNGRAPVPEVARWNFIIYFLICVLGNYIIIIVLIALSASALHIKKKWIIILVESGAEVFTEPGSA